MGFSPAQQRIVDDYQGALFDAIIRTCESCRHGVPVTQRDGGFFHGGLFCHAALIRGLDLKTGRLLERFHEAASSHGQVHVVVIGVVFDAAQQNIIYIDRKRPPLGPALPGGSIEAGEADINALRRELYEELGVRIAHVRRLTPQDRIWRSRDADGVGVTIRHIHAIGFSCVTEDTPQNLEPGAHNWARWSSCVSFDALPTGRNPRDDDFVREALGL